MKKKQKRGPFLKHRVFTGFR